MNEVLYDEIFLYLFKVFANNLDNFGYIFLLDFPGFREILKSRPPGNRDPEADEISACKPFLIQQLKAIKPKVIVALGKPAASTLLGRNVPITKERGTWHEYEGIKLMLTYHPAYLIRFPTLENRKAVHEDIKKVLKELKK